MTAPVVSGPEIEVDGDEPTALYRFYDRHGGLLYVGITVNLTQRWNALTAITSEFPLASRL